MATVRVLFCLLCGIAIGGSRPDGRNDVRTSVLQIATAELGVREVGNNGGPRVRTYLAYAGIKTPAPWCAAFLSYCFGRAGCTEPKTAWSPAMFPAVRLTSDPKPADVFGIYFENLQRIGHVGLVERLQGKFIFSIEGNTSADGSREGTGVFRRLRHTRTISKYADWITVK
ncbi:peptidoglycan-binding protein [Pedobacter sp. MC2016-24]|uniref:peptidoglycan-binding protein n=1 Tax=Pedobacter sp. MC2016-24 TaxID=2780090 RepID=UPI001D16F33A|nr:peptidoglycan-binding protein [Pedobacter sp. MC2016-24]